jgi:hypothetical protein
MEFSRAIDQACAKGSRVEVFDAGIAALTEALGVNAWAFLPAIDRLCRRLREFPGTKPFGPPTKATVGKPSAIEGSL